MSEQTKFTSDQFKTDKTDETDAVSNVGFLLTVFSTNLAETRPIVVSFEGNPTSVAGKAWYGHPWSPATTSIALPNNANNYFSLSSFRPDETGRYRRRKSQFYALHAVMLDDIGTKIAMDRLTLTPTWLLETSPGNYQAGYLLNQPLTDGKAADQLMNAIINAGLCDPGATGPRTRLARLPVAVNGKQSPPFICRMVTWAPERRYSMQQLIDGLQLEITKEKPSQHQAGRCTSAQPADGDPVWIPRPEENAVLVALRNHGLYKDPLG